MFPLRVLAGSLLVSALAGLAPAFAASIDAVKVPGGIDLIFVDGRMEYGDEKTFANVALPLDDAIVVLRSPGGNLNAGIEIGKAIHLKGFKTYVPDEQYCASACAIAWLGGQKRMMSTTARVGFHAAFTEQNGAKEVTSIGNALVGAYFAQLGLPEKAIVYLTASAPESIQWLTFEDAQSNGIEVTRLDLSGEDGGTPAGMRAAPSPRTPDSLGTPPAASVSTPATDPSVPTSHLPWAQYGDWVQIYSRAQEADAIQLAQLFQQRFPNVHVFRFTNGWYAVLLGPYPSGSGVPQKDALAAAGSIPSDSLLANTAKMAEHVYGTLPGTRVQTAAAGGRSATVGTPVEERARRLYLLFHQYWSGDDAQGIAFLNRVYSGNVAYYGRVIPKRDVLAEKIQFTERWPVRRYTVDESTMQVTCETECVVSGVVSWQTMSPARRASSTGAALYELRIAFAGADVMVTGENGKVLRRNLSGY